MKIKYGSSLILASFFLLSAFSLKTNAAVYVVTNTNNDGAGRLRGAISTANFTPDDDTVVFNIPGCSGTACTIYLSGGGGGTEIYVDAAGSLTVDAAQGAIVVNAQSQSRVFSVNPGANLTMKNITVTGGYSYASLNEPSYGGGRIYNKGTVTLINSVISGNSAGSLYISGGIANLGSLTLNNTKVSDNYAGYGGGGIGNYRTLMLINSTVSSNNGLPDGNGGGILNINSSANATITGSTISNNSAFTGPGRTSARSNSITRQTAEHFVPLRRTVR